MGLARAIARLFNLGYYDQSGGFQEGQVAVFGSAAFQVALPSWQAAQLQPAAGINRTAGVMGGGGTTQGEEISIQKLGYAKLLASPNVATQLGGQVIADGPPNLGNVRQRVPWSSSAQVLGHFEEARQVGNAPEHVEGEVRPAWLEIVRAVTGGEPGSVPLGNNVTRYLGPPGSALSQSPVALYRARFDGEVVRSLGATLQLQPSQNETVTVTVVKSSDGGTTWIDLAVSCQFAGPVSAADDLVRWVVLARGDLVALKVVSYSATAAGLIASLDVT